MVRTLYRKPSAHKHAGRPPDRQRLARRNFDLNGAAVLRDLHRLLMLAFGDAQLAERIQGDDDPLLELRWRNAQDELVHLLVGTAVLNRVREEHMRPLRKDPDELSFAPLTGSCGDLIPDLRKNETIPLTFREACNKIMHADWINLTNERGGRAPYDPITLNLRLSGTQGSKAWRAWLDLTAYARLSVKNFGDG